MEKFVKISSIILFTVLLLSFPFFVMIGLAGLGPDTIKQFIFIDIGYIGLVVFSFVCIFRYKFFPAVAVSIVLIIMGVVLNTIFENKRSFGECEKLRAEPSCVEDECGFVCSDYNGFRFETDVSICKDKNQSLCKIKRETIIRSKGAK